MWNHQKVSLFSLEFAHVGSGSLLVVHCHASTVAQNGTLGPERGFHSQLQFGKAPGDRQRRIQVSKVTSLLTITMWSQMRM